jgi:hypothetical protein
MAKIIIEVGNLSALDLQNKEKQLTIIAKQDNKVLERLAQMSKSKKAIDYISNTINWTALRGMLSI